MKWVKAHSWAHSLRDTQGRSSSMVVDDDLVTIVGVLAHNTTFTRVEMARFARELLETLEWETGGNSE